MKIQCPKCKQAVSGKYILVAVVVLGGIMALRYIGLLIGFDHIWWSRDFGGMQKTPEAMQFYRHIMATLLVKGSLGVIVFCLGLWALLKSGGRK
jgi:hypothetical protein